LLFVQDTGLKMTPVTLAFVIDDSKRERKQGRHMENDEACVRSATLRLFTIDCGRRHPSTKMPALY
jgi:hypothetical protein